MVAQAMQEETMDTQDTQALEQELDAVLAAENEDADEDDKRRRTHQKKPTNAAPLKPKLHREEKQDSSYPYRNHAWSAWEICESYAKNKNYRLTGGMLDTHRAANEILYDCINGVVVLSFEPPAMRSEKSAKATGRTIPAPQAASPSATTTAVAEGSDSVTT